MRERDRLDLLTKKAQRRAIRLRLLVEEFTPEAPQSWGRLHERAISYVVVEAANLWATYTRAHYVSTALRARIGPYERITLADTVPIRTRVDAITVAVLAVDPGKPVSGRPWTPRDEPDWQNPAVWQRLIAHIGASNLPAVERAAGYRPKSLDLLIRTRNYFAHKSERAGRSARRLPREYGEPHDSHPMLFLLRPAPGFVQPVLLQWLDDLILTLRLSDPQFGAK